jgi:CelD/BcsL family acetyltransferase involved in cellulose biosynthesis
VGAFDLSDWDCKPVDSLESLDDAFDQAALSTPGIASYCSSRDWAIAASDHLHPGREPWVVERDGSWLALTHGHHPQVGPYLQPLEGDWGFCAPVLGPNASANVQLLSAGLRHWERQWQVALLHGLDVNTADLVSTALQGRYRVVVRDGIRCRVASLEGGVDGFLSRRSSRFRRNLRRDRRRTDTLGVDYETNKVTDGVDALMARILAVEARSWKTTAGQSVLASRRYRAFYINVLERAAARGGARAAFARVGGKDVAYVFGAVLADGYRGFQLGFDAEWADLGVGNQVQLALIEALCDENIISYDLGMEMPYKARWAENLLPLRTVVVVNPL